MISITSEALAKLQEMSVALGVGHLKVRLRVQGGGCAGLIHELYFEEAPSDLDTQLNIEDITVFIDAISILYIEGTIIDYKESLFTSRFVFENPNHITCACGNSMSY